MAYLALIAVILIGLLAFIKPEWLWKIEHFLDVKNGEPTEWYLEKTRLLGIFFIVAALLTLALSI